MVWHSIVFMVYSLFFVPPERGYVVVLGSVMHATFTYVFVLDRNFEILILWIQEEIVQSQPLKSAVPISLNRQWLDQTIIPLRMHDLSALLYKA